MNIICQSEFKEASPNASLMTFIVSSKCLSLPDIDCRYAHVWSIVVILSDLGTISLRPNVSKKDCDLPNAYNYLLENKQAYFDLQNNTSQNHHKKD